MASALGLLNIPSDVMSGGCCNTVINADVTLT